MKRFFMCVLALMLCVSACAETALSPEMVCSMAANALVLGDYESILDMANDDVRAALDADTLGRTWEAQLASLGQVIGAEPADSSETSASIKLLHENGAELLIVTLDERGKLSGLGLQPVIESEPIERTLPEGATEREVTLFEGDARQLGGTLTLPAGADEATPYVVLIHGSGSSDRDEAVGPNKPFRDIAYDLAALGVGTLRFDKVTYAHPELGAETVTQEYLDPVTEAVRVLRAEVGENSIYAAGHSEGGMLMPWLVRECGFDGGIALAGTPDPLWMLSYLQNLEVIAGLPEEQQQSNLDVVEAEKLRAESLSEMTDEEAKAATIFGASAYYQKSIAALDEIAIAKETGKPMLFLWGERDLQVYEQNYEAWRNGLGESELYTYIRYPGLSHLFTPAEDSDSISNIMQAYMRPALVDEKVSQDIANWILAQ